MSHSRSAKQDRTTSPPSLPAELSAALKAARKNPAVLSNWETVNEVCRNLDRPDEASELYKDALGLSNASSTLKGDELENVGRLAADFCEEWYEDTARVLEMLSRVLELEPTQRWAFDRLTVLLTAAARWDALLSAYDVALDKAADPKEKVWLLEEAAKIARDFAAQHDRASDYIKALLLLRLGDEQLAAAAERRFDEQGRNEDLIEIWTARLPILEKSAAIKTHLQIASRYFEQLGDAECSLLAVTEFLEAGGNEAEACALLERIADATTAVVDARRIALERLDSLHSARGRWPEVKSVVERGLLLTEIILERVALHRKAITLYSDSGEPEQALEHCSAVLKLNPAAEDIRKTARSIAQQIGQMGRYTQALVEAASCAESVELRVELLLEAAEIEALVLNDLGSSCDLYFRVLRDTEASEAVKLLSCQKLGELLSTRQCHDELLAVLEIWAELEVDLVEKRQILGRAARLAGELQQPERALTLWTLCLKDTPEDDEALSMRIELLTNLGRSGELVFALCARSIVGDNVRRQRTDLVAAADVLSTQIGDLDAAIKLWRSCEERFGRDDQTVDSLVLLLNQAQQYGNVAVLLGEAISEELDSRRVVIQLALLGDIFRLYLAQEPEALLAYARALKIECRMEQARQGLMVLLRSEPLAHAASEHLVEAYRQAGDVEQIVELSELRLSFAPSSEFRAKILLEVAQIHERGALPVDALFAVGRAFALTPTAEIEGELHRLAEKTERWDAVADGYLKAIEGCSEQLRLAALFLARGQVEQLKLHRPSEATSSYKESLIRKPDSVNVAVFMVRAAHQAQLFADAAWALVENSRALGDLSKELFDSFAECATEHGDWVGSLEGMADQIATAEELSAKIAHDIKKQLAIWYRDQIADPDSAELVLKRAAADYPHEETLRMLAELQRRNPGRSLVATLCSLAEIAVDDVLVLREAGEVALTAVRDFELAQPILEQALAQSSKVFVTKASTPAGADAQEICIWATENLLQLALSTRNFERGVELLQVAAELPFADDEKLARLFLAAQVAADGAMDEVAVALCEQIIVAQPYHEGAITLLSSLHEKSGRLDDLLSLRRRELLLDRPMQRRLFLRLDQARVIGALEGSSEERIKVLRENLVDQPGHEGSIVALAAILDEGQAFAPLTALYEEQADVLSSHAPERSALLWERAGILASERLDDQNRMVSAFKKSAAANPSIFVVASLAKIAHENANWDEEVSWLSLRLALTKEVVETPNTPDDRRDVVVALGQALIRTDEWGAACTLLESELGKDPASDGARRLLADIYRQASEWSLLSGLLADGVQYAPSESAQIAYLREAAIVYRKQLGDVESTVPLLEEAISLDSNDKSLKLMLADNLRLCERYSESRELLHGILEEFGRRRTRERAIVHMQLARIAAAIDDIEEAVQQADSAANIERADPAILMLVGQLARRNGALDRAEQAYRTLALIAGRRSSQGVDSTAEEVGESTVLFELHRIALEKGDNSQARELLDSAINVATRDEQEALRLGDALAKSEQLNLLTSALELVVSSGLRGEAASRVLLTKANVLEQAGYMEEAFSTRLLAMKETPADTRLLESTQRLAEQVQRSGEFWSHVVQLAELANDEASIAGELLYRAGQAAEALGDRDGATLLYERTQNTGYKPRRTFLALDGVLDEGSEPDRVRHALTVFVSSKGAEVNPTVFADSLYRLAEMELLHLKLDEATDYVMRAMDLDPQADRVVAMFESHVREGSASTQMIELFLNVCRKAAPDDLLLFAFKQAAPLPSFTFNLVTEAVALARRLDEQEALRLLLTRAIELAVDPDSPLPDMLVERAQMARSDGEFLLESALLARAIPLFDVARAFELRLRLAACLTGDQKCLADGLVILEQLFGEAPTDGRVWRPLLAAYRAIGATSKIEAVIELISDDVTDESDLEALKLERIHLMMGDGRDEEAEAELRAVLAHHPQMSDAAALLIQVLKSANREGELRELLTDLWDQARSRRDSVRVGQYGIDLAKVFSVSDREEAINVLVTGLEFTKSNRELLVYLLSLYTENDNQSEKSDVMELLIVLSVPDEAKRLTLELVHLRNTIGDQFGVGRALEVGVKAAPADAELSDLWLSHLRATGEHSAVAEALMMRAGQTSGDAAVSSLVEAASLYDEYLGDPAKAAGAFELAYLADPSDVTFLRKSVELTINAGEIEQALLKLDEAIKSSQEFLLADLLQLRAQIIARERMLDPVAMTQAAADLAKALEQFIPEEQERELKTSRVQVLTELRTLHQLEADEVNERRVVRQLAVLLLANGEYEASTDILASWLRDHEDDVEVARELGSRATEVRDYDAAIFAYQKMADACRGPEKVAAVLLLSDAALAAGDPGVARLALEEAFSLEPQNMEVLSRLRGMYESTGAYGELAAILRLEVDNLTDFNAKFDLLVQVGELQLKAGASEAAQEALLKARDLNINASLVISKLAQVHLAVGESEEARVLLDEAIKENGKRRSPELALLQAGLSQVEAAAGNVDGMFGWLEAALMSDRNNVEIASELAVRAQDAGRHEIAVKALQTITLSKREGGMGKAEAYLRQAQIASEQGDEKKALLLGRRAQAADAELPGLIEFLSRLGG